MNNRHHLRHNTHPTLPLPLVTLVHSLSISSYFAPISSLSSRRTRSFSRSRVSITTTSTFSLHTMRQKSFSVAESGPWLAIYFRPPPTCYRVSTTSSSAHARKPVQAGLRGALRSFTAYGYVIGIDVVGLTVSAAHMDACMIPCTRSVMSRCGEYTPHPRTPFLSSSLPLPSLLFPSLPLPSLHCT